MKRYIISALILLTTAQSCFCANEVASEDLHQALKTTSGHEPGVFSILMALFLVICLIYVTGIIYSKLNIMSAKTVKDQLKRHDLSGVIVLSTTQLGQGKNLHVIELNGKQLLIGATPSSINLIKELDNEDTEIDKDKDLYKKTIEAEEELIEEFDLHKKYL